jgi:hypothetical protein
MMAKKLPTETEFVVQENQIWHRPTGARFYLRDGFDLIDLMECESAPRAADTIMWAIRARLATRSAAATERTRRSHRRVRRRARLSDRT